MQLTKSIITTLVLVIALGLLWWWGSTMQQAAPAQQTNSNIMADTSTNPEQPAQGGLNALKITILEPGSGQAAAAGDQVTVEYEGRLIDGTVFDASSRHGQPFSFTLGAGQVIAGWDQGLTGMRVGETRKLEIPAALAYGERGAGALIPANAELIFEVKLLAIE